MFLKVADSVSQIQSTISVFETYYLKAAFRFLIIFSVHFLFFSGNWSFVGYVAQKANKPLFKSSLSFLCEFHFVDL